MRRGRSSSPDKYLIKSVVDAKYYSANIPSTAWGPLLTQEPKFKTLMVHDDDIPAKTQSEWFSRLQKGEMFSAPYLVLIGSELDDSLALAYSYDLMKRALRLDLAVQITESSAIQREEVEDESVFMLTNLYDDVPVDRLQSVRDWCRKHEACFRLLCVAGDVATFIRKLKIEVNAVFLLDSRIVSERNLG